jgi:predicted transporter
MCVPCPVCLSSYAVTGIFIVLLFKKFKIQIKDKDLKGII